MENQHTEQKNLPEQKFKAGAISAAVWKNTGQDKQGNELEYRSITFQRTYKDRNGEWKTTTSLRLNDLPKASVVINEAYRYLVLQGEAEGVVN
jgi:hypothetical protein